VAWKDLLLVARDRSALVGLLLVPVVVIVFIAESQAPSRGAKASSGKTLLLPIVNLDQGPVAAALIKLLGEHVQVELVDRDTGVKRVRDQNRAAAVLVLPEGLSKRYLTERPSEVELLTDPAQWAALQAIKVMFLLADKQAAALADPFKQELLVISEQSLTGPRLKFSSVEQTVPGFSLMFMLLSLVYGVAFSLHDEEAWGTRPRLRIAPVRRSAILGGKLLARGVVAALQLSILLGFGHLVYGIALGRPALLFLVVVVIALSTAGVSSIIAALARTKEQILPIGLVAVFVLAVLGGCFWPYAELPRWMQILAEGAVTTWSMFALLDVMLRDRDLLEVLPRLVALALFGIGAFAAGSLLLRGRERAS
jgi:ABC-2 type transport system permease protein